MLLCYAADKPKFMCNNTVVVAFLQEDVHIKCRVHADPQIDHFRIYWSPLSKNNNITLEGNSSEGSYHAGIEDGVGTLIILSLFTLFKIHYYNIIVPGLSLADLPPPTNTCTT